MLTSTGGRLGFADYLDLCVSLPVIFFFFQETKQKSLEEIDLLFGGRTVGLHEGVTMERFDSMPMHNFDKEEGISTNVEDTSDLSIRAIRVRSRDSKR